jgi:hypothetical protein
MAGARTTKQCEKATLPADELDVAIRKYAPGKEIARDEHLASMPSTAWKGKSAWNWADAGYQQNLLGFDVFADTRKRFEEWNVCGASTQIAL